MKLVHKHIPYYTSLERSIAARNGKMYLDFFKEPSRHNHCGLILTSPKSGATVSTPLSWDKVKLESTIQHFNICKAINRFKETDDLYNGVLGEEIDVMQTLKKVKSILFKLFF